MLCEEVPARESTLRRSPRKKIHAISPSPLRSSPRQRDLDPFLDELKAMVTDPMLHLGQYPLTLVLDLRGEVTTPRVIEPGHFSQASSFAIRDPVANARHGFGGVEHR